jgi:ribosomal protein S18 acetylase RimI-like enzyme
MASTSGPRRRTRTLRYRGGVARIGSFRGRRDVGQLAIAGDVPPAGLLERSLATLAAEGYREVLTAPVAPPHSETLRRHGFQPLERLEVLARSLPARLRPTGGSIVTRRARRGDRERLPDLDAAAFAPFWQLGPVGIADAIDATPHARVSVVGHGDDLAGYAIFGRAGTVGYVQRLAVAPLHRAQGIGRALMLDGLAWLARRRVQTVFVNTQHDNTIALALYESLGFRRQPTGLQILALPLGAGSTTP